MSGYLLQARALGGEHYVELTANRPTTLVGFQRDALDRALRHLLRATTPGEALDLEDIEVGIAELPWVDDDYAAGGDPGGKLLLPERRMGAVTSEGRKR